MNIIKKLLLYISSPALALLLLFAVFVLLVIGANPWMKSLYRYPASFFNSWIFVAVNAALLINLFFCIFKQLRQTLKCKWSLNRLPENIESSRTFDFNMVAQKTKELFRCYGFRCDTNNEGELTAHKRSSGKWGGFVFHMGLIVICAGTFIELACSFSGRIGMVPGQMFEHRLKNFSFISAGPLYNYNKEEFSLFLHNIKTKYKNTGVFASGDISLIVDGLEYSRQEIAAGSPLRFKLWNFYLENFGYYVKTRIGTGRDEILLNIGLSTTIENEYEKYSEEFDLENSPYRLNIEFIPNVSSYKNSGEKSYKPDQPAIKLIVYKNEKGLAKQVFNGLVAIKQTANFDQGAKVTFEAFYPWITLNAKKEPGLYLIYIGFMISLIGLLLLYLWVPENITVKIFWEDGVLKCSVEGWTARYKKEFQQRLRCIKEELAGLLSKEG